MKRGITVDILDGHANDNLLWKVLKQSILLHLIGEWGMRSPT